MLVSLLAGLDSEVYQMDNVLTNQGKHNTRLTAALEQIQAARITLNPEKGKFRQTAVMFLDTPPIHPGKPWKRLQQFLRWCPLTNYMQVHGNK